VPACSAVRGAVRAQAWQLRMTGLHGELPIQEPALCKMQWQRSNLTLHDLLLSRLCLLSGAESGAHRPAVRQEAALPAAQLLEVR